MTRANPLLASSNAGELSPRLHARTDFSKYPNGLETSLNLILLAEGGAMRRPGSRFVVEVKDSSKKSRLRRFRYSTEQAYVIELADRAMRFCRNQGQITAANITGSITNGTFPTDLSNWTDKDTGGTAASTWNTAGYMQLLGDGTNYAWRQQTVSSITNGAVYSLKFRVIGAPGDEVTLQVGTSDGGFETVNRAFKTGYHCFSFTAAATTIYVGFRSQVGKALGIDDVAFIDNSAIEVDTPYPEADLYRIEGPQSANVLYLYHPSYPTHKLERYGHTSWSLIQVAWQDGPWLDENATSTTLTFSAATGLGVTVTASAVTGINDNEGFKTTDVGRLIRLSDGTVNWGWAIITAWTSTTVVTADVKRSVVVTTAETKWRLGAWSGTTGYPSCAAFFEQRLFTANTTNQPQTLWASNTGDFEVMSPDSANSSGVWGGTVEDDDGLDYTISGDEVQSIIWLSPGEDTLAIGTASGEWTPSSKGAVLTPTDIAIRQQTTHGSKPVRPVRVGNIVLFLHRAGRKLLEFGFAYEIDGFRAANMTRLAEHITKGGVVGMAFAEEPNSLVHAVRADGVAMSMTYRRDEDVVGWGRHILGGAFGSGHAVVECVETIPGTDGAGQVESSEDRDEVWLQVKRTINGQTKRYIEVFEKDFEGPIKGDYATEALWRAAMLAAQKHAYYADSLITYNGSATDTITGLSHLEGQTVKVLADGAVHPDCVVSSGQITLEAEASVVQIGLGYTHRGKTLKIEAGAVAGTAVGKVKVINAMTFVLHNSLTISFSDALGDLYQTEFREVADAMDSAAPLFSGEVRYELESGWKEDPRIQYESDDPVPFTLLAIAPEIVTQDVT